MDRRTFFKNLIGGAVIATLPVKLFDNITEYVYQAELQDKPERIFPHKEGIWIYDEDTKELLGWGSLAGTSMNMVDITALESNGWVQSIPSRKTLWWEVPQFHTKKIDDIFINKCKLIMVAKNHLVYTGDVYMTMFNNTQNGLYDVQFQLTGALISPHDDHKAIT